MKCPVDGIELMMTSRSGVEIDYCPQCRGVWLDRGELDKLIERAEAAMERRAGKAAAPAYGDRYSEPAPYRYDDDDDRRRSYPDREYDKPKRKRSVFGEMFDLFD
ncbi:MAG: zf-TFIIB domain-containing protein [Anaerolineae bacterium]